MKDTAKIIGEKRLRLKLKKIPKEILSNSLMSEVGNVVITNIKKRTMKGVDFKEHKFKEYSPKYKFIREGKGLPANIVDLFFTGSMMSSMTFEAKTDEVRIFFMPTRDKKGSANPEKAFYLDQKRKFFEISKKDEDEIIGLVENTIDKAVTSGR